MKFYYVAHEFNPEQPVQTAGGRRLAYYTKKQQALAQCKALINQYRAWRDYIKSQNTKIYKVYCVESEPQEVTSD